VEDKAYQKYVVTTVLSEALKYEENYDYEAALRVIDKTPKTLRDLKYFEESHEYLESFEGSTVSIKNQGNQGVSESVNEAYNRIQSLVTKFEFLDDSIQKLLRQGSIYRALDTINKILVLQPNRKDLIELKSQLIESCSKSVSVSEQNFKVMSVLDQSISPTSVRKQNTKTKSVRKQNAKKTLSEPHVSNLKPNSNQSFGKAKEYFVFFFVLAVLLTESPSFVICI